MLNWDEYNKEDTQVAPAIKNTTPEIPQPVEPVAQSKPVTEEASSSNIEAGSRAEAARKAMETFDASEGVRELDEMHSGRVQVVGLGLLANVPEAWPHWLFFP